MPTAIAPQPTSRPRARATRTRPVRPPPARDVQGTNHPGSLHPCTQAGSLSQVRMAMAAVATRASRDALRRLPTTARPVVDPADVVAPEGYEVEPVLVGLSFPCGMGFADDGSLFLLEGGSTWPTRPYMPARILRLDTASGKVDEVGVEVLGA